MVSTKVSRRRFVAGTAVASTALVAAPFVRSAYAAGKLSVGFWDHWVPGANKATTDLVKEWADKEKVEVTIDYITSQGNKLLLTTAAEAQAKSGHDILAMNTFLPARYADQLVPMDDGQCRTLLHIVDEDNDGTVTLAEVEDFVLGEHMPSHVRVAASTPLPPSPRAERWRAWRRARRREPCGSCVPPPRGRTQGSGCPAAPCPNRSAAAAPPARTTPRQSSP